MRIGAGLVTVVGNATATTINATHLTAIMVRAVAGRQALEDFLGDIRRNAVLIGPGASVGPETADEVLAILKSSAAVVLDADALTSFADEDRSGPRAEAGMGFLARNGDAAVGPEALFAAIKARQASVVMTPHEGEFKRLFGEIPGSKLDRARAAAERSGAIIVLKGHRHGDRSARRTRSNQFQRAAVAGDGRFGRRALGLHYGASGATHACIRSGVCGSLAARRMRQ